MTDLIALHAEFWDFRRMMALYWIIPDNPDAARFAVTEAAEVLKTNGLWEAFVAFAASRQAQIAAADALDAVMRRNASYSRNTVRDMDERNELGDLAMMLMTAVGPREITPAEIKFATMNEETSTIDSIVHWTAFVHESGCLSYSGPRNYAMITLRKIDIYPGMDLPLILRSRMNRIYRKHHPDAGRTFPVAEGEAYQNETMRALLLVLPNERPVSWNDFYSGQHWSVRKAEKDRVQMVVRSVLDPDTPIFDQPVEITVSAYFDIYPLDSSNIAAKFYEDAIKGWIIKDDDWRHVRSVTTQSHMDRQNPRVEILIEESRL